MQIRFYVHIAMDISRLEERTLGQDSTISFKFALQPITITGGFLVVFGRVYKSQQLYNLKFCHGHAQFYALQCMLHFQCSSVQCFTFSLILE